MHSPIIIASIPILLLSSALDCNPSDECAEEVSELGDVCPPFHSPNLDADADSMCEGEADWQDSDDTSSGSGKGKCATAGSCRVWCEPSGPGCPCGISSIGGDGSVICAPLDQCPPNCGDGVCSGNEDFTTCGRDCKSDDATDSGGQDSGGGQVGQGCEIWDPNTALEIQSGVMAEGSKCHRFTLPEVGHFTATIFDAEPGPRVDLYHDANGDGQYGADEKVAVPNNPTSIEFDLERGTYFAVVHSRTPATYGLSMTFTPYGVPSPATDPGERPNETAYPLDLSAPVVLGGYVGLVDVLDYYRFELDKPDSVSINVSDVGDFRVVVSVMSDTNGNGLFESAELIAREKSGALETVLDPGVYYFELHSHFFVGAINTTYTLTVERGG